MLIRIKKKDLSNKFDFCNKVYDILVKDFIKILKCDYKNYMLNHYNIPVELSDDLVVCRFEGTRILIGVDSPENYSSSDLCYLSEYIRKYEYGSFSDKIHPTPILREYSSSMTKVYRIMWIKYLYDTLEDRR